jgi:Skp family chaperone for outer membrane proteins
MKFLKIYIFTVLIIFFRVANAYDEAAAKIAVVDVESILENSLAIGAIRKSINELSKTIENEINEQEKEYKKRQQELLEVQKTVSQEKFDSLVLKFNKSVSKIQKNIQQKKIALEHAHSQAIEVVHQKTISIIGDLAKKYSLDIVLPTSQVLYIKSELNITPEVISKLNNDLKEVPINYQKFLKN